MEKTGRDMEEQVAHIRFTSQNLRFIFFVDSGKFLCYRKDLKRFTKADKREADAVMDLLMQEPAGFA
jgi:hypothetical protein